MKNRRIVAYIPVRGGSKGLPGKNIKCIAGKPLLHWVTYAALNTANIDAVVIATDSQDIADSASMIQDSKLTVFLRSAENCTDTASSEAAMLEYALTFDDFTHMMLIQATSPLLQAIHLEEAIESYTASEANSMVALVRQHKFIWEQNAQGLVKPLNYNPLKRPRRQEFDGLLTEPGAFYMTPRESLLNTGCRVSGTIFGYELPPELYIDLDTMLDWEIVESMLRKRQNSTQENSG